MPHYFVYRFYGDSDVGERCGGVALPPRKRNAQLEARQIAEQRYHVRPGGFLRLEPARKKADRELVRELDRQYRERLLKFENEMKDMEARML